MFGEQLNRLLSSTVPTRTSRPDGCMKYGPIGQPAMVTTT